MRKRIDSALVVGDEWCERERRTRLRAAILRVLKRHGPMTVRGLEARIRGGSTFSLTQCARQLLDGGRVATRLLIDPTKSRRAALLLWLLPLDQNREPGPDFNGIAPPISPEDQEDNADRVVRPCSPLALQPGVADADLAWQAYYRLPRAERLRTPPPESGRGIAGWDCPRTLDELRQGGLSEGEGRP